MDHLLILLDLLSRTNVSCLLIAPSGHGKTTSLLRSMRPGSHLLNDFTSSSLRAKFRLNNNDRPKRIVCTDFNLPMSHKSSVRDLLVADMLQPMAEGVKELGAGEQFITFSKTVHMAFSLAITPAILQRNIRHWIDIGFIRRLIPIAWHWTNNLKKEAMNGDPLGYVFPNLSGARKKSGILSPGSISYLQGIAIEISEGLKWEWIDSHGKQREMQVYEDYNSIYRMLEKMAKVSSVEEVQQLTHLITLNYRRNALDLK